MGCGLAALLDKNLDLGETCLEKAVGFMPAHLGTWNALAWVRIMKNDISGAESAIEIALERDRTFAESHGMLAVIRILQGQRDIGAESAKRALQLDAKCFSGRFAQTLLLDPERDVAKIQARIQSLMAAPIAEGGSTIAQNLQRYFRKHR